MLDSNEIGVLWMIYHSHETGCWFTHPDNIHAAERLIDKKLCLRNTQPYFLTEEGLAVIKLLSLTLT